MKIDLEREYNMTHVAIYNPDERKVTTRMSPDLIMTGFEVAAAMGKMINMRDALNEQIAEIEHRINEQEK